MKRLTGPIVALEPIAERHREELRAASDDAEVWRYSPVAGARTLSEHLDKWFDVALANLASGKEIPFAIRRLADGRVVGSSRYLNLAPEHRRLEIGATWYAADARGTQVNPAAKLLLFEHAFEVLKSVRVELKCDARNLRSRRAIAALGAREEGTLRRHMILGDGFIRDTVYFSVLDDEWPAVRSRLLDRLAR